MQRISIFPKILRATHEHSDLFQHGHGPSVDLGPCSIQPVDWSRSKSRNDGEQGREIVHRAAFLQSSVSLALAFSVRVLTSATETKCLMTTTLFLTSD